MEGQLAGRELPGEAPSGDVHPAAEGSVSSASEPEEDTRVLVLLWLWKRQPKDTATSLERSPEADCPLQPVAGKAGTQPRSRAARKLCDGIGRANAAPSAISYPLAASPVKETKKRNREALCSWAAAPCTTSLHFTCQVQNMRTEPVLKAAFLQPWGCPSPPFS
ncbi:uncharacterized protein LOC141928072 isoform X2 [Strix aluco]|uniref:uncharacterized protein LOC141928072 isoform X2 n=1 Tax=Strix aluco TaxID=111821 RepID=UPI003DA3DD43